jgi:hypothetical protein
MRRHAQVSGLHGHEQPVLHNVAHVPGERALAPVKGARVLRERGGVSALEAARVALARARHRRAVHVCDDWLLIIWAVQLPLQRAPVHRAESHRCAARRPSRVVKHARHHAAHQRGGVIRSGQARCP